MLKRGPHIPSRRAFLKRLSAALVAGHLPRFPWSFCLATPQSGGKFPFALVPPSVSGISWVHHNGRSPEMYLPETVGAGCAFIDYDSDGWMDISWSTVASVISSTPSHRSATRYTGTTATEHSLT